MGTQAIRVQEFLAIPAIPVRVSVDIRAIRGAGSQATADTRDSQVTQAIVGAGFQDTAVTADKFGQDQSPLKAQRQVRI